MMLSVVGFALSCTSHSVQPLCHWQETSVETFCETPLLLESHCNNDHTFLVEDAGDPLTIEHISPYVSGSFSSSSRGHSASSWLSTDDHTQGEPLSVQGFLFSSLTSSKRLVYNAIYNSVTLQENV